MSTVFRSGLLVAMVVFLAGCSGQDWNSTDVSGVMPDLQFTLTSETGEEVGAEAFEGQVSLVFFGFTHCPDVCPLTLANLASQLRALPEDEREQIQVLFVSVDPARDTPELLADYTSAFGPDFVGLTGTQAQLRELTRRYRVTYSYAEPDENGNYDVSHSSGVFAFNRDNEAVVLMRDNMPPDQQLADIRQLING